jgi:hypothetical protein
MRTDAGEERFPFHFRKRIRRAWTNNSKALELIPREEVEGEFRDPEVIAYPFILRNSVFASFHTG